MAFDRKGVALKLKAKIDAALESEFRQVFDRLPGDPAEIDDILAQQAAALLGPRQCEKLVREIAHSIDRRIDAGESFILGFDLIGAAADSRLGLDQSQGLAQLMCGIGDETALCFNLALNAGEGVIEGAD